MFVWRNDDPVHPKDDAYMEIGVALLRGNKDDDSVFQPPKKQQQLERIVPAVPAKPEQASKAPPKTADWLTGRLAGPKRGRQRGGWSRGGGRGGGSRRGFVRGRYLGSGCSRRF